MKKFGFARIAAVSPRVRVADCVYNTCEIIGEFRSAEAQGAEVVVFPEMSITGYTCADLFNQQLLRRQAETALGDLCDASKDIAAVAVVGLPLAVDNRLYNIGAVVAAGRIWGIVPKTFIPNYNEFYDKRWFASSRELKRSTITLCGQSVPIGCDMIFEVYGFSFAIEICEDLWASIPPSSLHALYGAEIILNLSASNETAGKHDYRRSLVCQQSARTISGYVYAAAGAGESTTDIVFSGCSLIAENGALLSEAERFSQNSQMLIADIDIDRLRNDRIKNQSFSTSEYSIFDDINFRRIAVETLPQPGEKTECLLRRIDPLPFVPKDDARLNERCEEIFSIQVAGLMKRLAHTSIQKAVVGVSGGLDSTLALLVMVEAFDRLGLPRANITGITMPGFGTTNRTYKNSISMMRSLGVTPVEISIVAAVEQHFKDIGHDPEVHDITYENSQARERTQILMDYANKVNGLVVGTGDLSELALGWCTYNGDHMSMYGVNTGVPKTLVRTLVKWVSAMHMDASAKEVLNDIIDTPVSPELLPAAENGDIVQCTEDIVGPYILHDFFLYYVLRFGFAPDKIYYLARHAFAGEFAQPEILKWMTVFFRRFFSQQFKRSCMPDGPKVGSVNLSPRGDWRMPSDASAAMWLEQLKTLGQAD